MFRVSDRTRVVAFKAMVHTALGVPPAAQRLWTWALREGCAWRPERPVLDNRARMRNLLQDEGSGMGALATRHGELAADRLVGVPELEVKVGALHM